MRSWCSSRLSIWEETLFLQNTRIPTLCRSTRFGCQLVTLTTWTTHYPLEQLDSPWTHLRANSTRVSSELRSFMPARPSSSSSMPSKMSQISAKNKGYSSFQAQTLSFKRSLLGASGNNSALPPLTDGWTSLITPFRSTSHQAKEIRSISQKTMHQALYSPWYKTLVNRSQMSRSSNLSEPPTRALWI
jgi:hypothetical protein